MKVHKSKSVSHKSVFITKWKTHRLTCTNYVCVCVCKNKNKVMARGQSTVSHGMDKGRIQTKWLTSRWLTNGRTQVQDGRSPLFSLIGEHKETMVVLMSCDHWYHMQVWYAPGWRSVCACDVMPSYRRWLVACKDPESVLSIILLMLI